MKHRIIGLIVLFALGALSIQFFLGYQKGNRHYAHGQLQAYRSPPVSPLSTEMTRPENAPTIQSTDELLRQHFDASTDAVPIVPAWMVQVASLSTLTAAQTLLAQCQGLGFDSFILPIVEGDQTSYRVNVGPFTQQPDAMAAISSIQKGLKMTGILKHYSPSAPI